jgi:small basic protein (TIGR04137 family)
MSVHPSLKASSESKQHKSVLKRLERLLHLIKKDDWKEGNSVFGLPKVKILKFKIKKEKTKEAEDAQVVAGEGVEGGAPAADGSKTEPPTPKKESGKK